MNAPTDPLRQVDPRAGKLIPASERLDIPRLITAYYSERPDPAAAAQRVAFGTSGHRGSSFERTFNETHILAIAQAVCDYRVSSRSTGRCSSASTRMPCPTRPMSRRSKCSPRTTSTR